jgi:hypothetical protein
VYVLPRGATGDAGLFIGNSSTGGNPTKFGLINTTTSQGAIFSQGQLAIVGYVGGATGPNAIADFKADGSAIILGSNVAGGCDISVNGDTGLSRVNDPRYNPAVSNTGFSFTAGPALSGNGVYSGSDITLDPGLYLFQLELGLNNSGSFNIPSPGSLVFYLADVSGGGFRPFSEMNITNTMIVSPGVGTANEPTFSSAVITITTSTACSVAYEIDGSWDLGTGKQAKFQIIQLA